MQHGILSTREYRLQYLHEQMPVFIIDIEHILFAICSQSPQTIRFSCIVVRLICLEGLTAIG